MTPRERVQDSLQHRQPDRIPYHLTFTAPAREKMKEYSGDPDFEASLANCLAILRTRLPERELAGQLGIWEDEFGVQWDRRIDPDIGTVCNRRVTPETLNQCRFPDPCAPDRFAHFPAALREKGERFAVATVAFTLFERAWTLAGMEDAADGHGQRQALRARLFDRILEYDLEVIRQALRFDVDGVRFGDDWGEQRGLIMGPALWREFIKPRMRRAVRPGEGQGEAGLHPLVAARSTSCSPT